MHIDTTAAAKLIFKEPKKRKETAILPLPLPRKKTVAAKAADHLCIFTVR